MVPHFLIKKGHLGRYRFTLMNGSSRLSGEVQIAAGQGGGALQAHALSEIEEIAKALRIAVDRAQRSDDVAMAEVLAIVRSLAKDLERAAKNDEDISAIPDFSRLRAGHFPR